MSTIKSRIAIALFSILVGLAIWQAPLLRWSFALLFGILSNGEFGVLEERELATQGIRLLKMGQPAEAKRVLLRAIAIDPYGEFRRELAEACQRVGHLDDAWTHGEAHVKNFPQDGRGYLLLAELARLKGQEENQIRAILQRGQSAVLEALDEKRTLATPADERSKKKHRDTIELLSREANAIDLALGAITP
jgi:hypothetical protein